MAKYRLSLHADSTIEAEQWFKFGDVSDANIKNIPMPEGLCKKCNAEPKKHSGLIMAVNDEGIDFGIMICPGDYIVTDCNGKKQTMSPAQFKATYAIIK